MKFLKKILTIVCVLFVSSTDLKAVEHSKINNIQNSLRISTWKGAGFFASLRYVLWYALKNHKPGQNLYVDWSYEFFPYKDDPYMNAYNLFFEPVSKFPHHLPKVEFNKNQFDYWEKYESYFEYRRIIAEYVKYYFPMKEKIIQSKLMNEIYQEMAGYYSVGVHIRYSLEHGGEVKGGPPELEDYERDLRHFIELNANKKLKFFLATDSEFALNWFRKTFDDFPVFSIPCKRDEYKKDLNLIFGSGDYYFNHPEEFHKNKLGYQGGIEALTECLMLSKCKIFFHTNSCLSEFVTYFNPYIESKYVLRIEETHQKKTQCSSQN